MLEILDNPDADEPRLVYADYLEERGDPRAEFIRLQIQLAKMSPYDENIEELRVREAELLTAHHATWLGSLPNTATSWTFHRGFVESVAMTGASFVSNAAELAQFTPLRSVQLCDVHHCIGDIAKCEFLGRLTGLLIDDFGLHDVGLTVLAHSKYLRQMERLILNNCGVGSRGLTALVTYGNMHELRFLDLSRNTIRNDAIKLLSGSPMCRNLEVLLLAENEIRLLGAKALADSNYLRNLKYIDVRNNLLGISGVELLRNRFGRDKCDA